MGAGPGAGGGINGFTCADQSCIKAPVPESGAPEHDEHRGEGNAAGCERRAQTRWSETEPKQTDDPESADDRGRKGGQQKTEIPPRLVRMKVSRVEGKGDDDPDGEHPGERMTSAEPRQRERGESDRGKQDGQPTGVVGERHWNDAEGKF